MTTTDLRRLAWLAWRAPTTLLDRHVRARRLAGAIRHVSGPTQVECGIDEVVATCVVRNGALHMRSFIEHHFALGVRHIVFLDNGSTDDTVAIAAGYERVTVLQSALPYRNYEIVMKRYLAGRFSANRWNLCVDIDERFDYPRSRPNGLVMLIRYLNQHRYTALLAQMLDMLPAGPGGEPSRQAGLPDEFPWYDITNIRRTAYTWGRIPDESVSMHWDGVRHTLFGTRNGLTKAALALVSDDTALFVDWHHAPKSVIADVTGVLLHYPFAGDFAGKVREAVRTGRYGYRTTDEYRRYLRAIETGAALSPPPGARRLTVIDDLVSQQFLVESGRYRDWMTSQAGVAT